MIERRLVDGDELASVVGALTGHPVVNASWILGSMVLLDLGEIRARDTDSAAGEFVFTLERGSWHVVGPDRDLVHSESPAEAIRASFEQDLLGSRVSSADYVVTTMRLKVEFTNGSELVVSPHDEGGIDDESWCLTTPDGRAYSMFPGGRIELEHSRSA